jgi:hypothetical protein
MVLKRWEIIKMKVSRLFDNYLGRYFTIEQKGYIQTKQNWAKGQKTMDANEWFEYRTEEKDESVSSLVNWLSLLACKESRKFHIYEAISSLIKKEGYSKVLDIACGQGHVASLLSLSGIQVSATEMSPESLLMANFPVEMPFRIDKILFDQIDVEYLRSVDLCYLVEVDYIFTTAQLVTFMTIAQEAKTDVLFVNTQIIGPLRGLKNLLLRKKRKENRMLKEHGFVRTLGQYKKICKESGANVEYLNRNIGDMSSYYVLASFKKS